MVQDRLAVRAAAHDATFGDGPSHLVQRPHHGTVTIGDDETIEGGLAPDRTGLLRIERWMDEVHVNRSTVEGRRRLIPGGVERTRQRHVAIDDDQ